MLLRNRKGCVAPIILDVGARACLQHNDSTRLMPLLARHVESRDALDGFVVDVGARLDQGSGTEIMIVIAQQAILA